MLHVVPSMQRKTSGCAVVPLSHGHEPAGSAGGSGGCCITSGVAHAGREIINRELRVAGLLAAVSQKEVLITHTEQPWFTGFTHDKPRYW